MSRRGMTLVEVLMTVLIMAGISGVFYSVSTAGDRLWGRAGAQLTAMSNTQQALNRLGDDLRLAQLSTLSCPAGTIRFRQGTATTVTYQLNGTNLERRTDNGQPARVVASGLSVFTINTCNTTGLVTVTLTATRDTHYESAAQTLRSSFWVRSQ